MWPGDARPGGLGQMPQAVGGRVAVHPGAAAVEQDRPVSAVCDCPVNGPADCWRQRDKDNLGAFSAHAQDPVAVLLAQVGDVGTGGRKDPQAQQPEHDHQRGGAPVR